MRDCECIRQDDKAASRLTRKADYGRFDFRVANPNSRVVIPCL
jgi:hypothetical protein